MKGIAIWKDAFSTVVGLQNQSTSVDIAMTSLQHIIIMNNKKWIFLAWNNLCFNGSLTFIIHSSSKNSFIVSMRRKFFQFRFIE